MASDDSVTPQQKQGESPLVLPYRVVLQLLSESSSLSCIDVLWLSIAYGVES